MKNATFKVIVRAAEAPEFMFEKEFENQLELEMFYVEHFDGCQGRRFFSESESGNLIIAEELIACAGFHYHITRIEKRSVTETEEGSF